MKKFLKKGIAILTTAAIICSMGAGALPAFAENDVTTFTYDMAQGMAFLDCTNANGMTAASANNGTGMWSFGYTKNGTLTYYPELQRRLWNVAAGKVDAWGGATLTVNDRMVIDPFTLGAIGYGFGTQYEWNTLPLGSTASTHIQPTAVWKAQYPGSVSAVIRLGQTVPTESTADGVLFRVEKISTSGTTTVYPTEGTTYTSGDGSTGWAKVTQGTAPATVNFTATVLAGDRLVLRFDSNQNDTEDRMCLYSYVLTETVNTADITGTDGSDHLAPVTEAEDDSQNMHFTLDQMFAVRNLFTRYTGTSSYLNYRGNAEVVDGAPTGLYTGLVPVTENDEDSRFEVGYYGLGSTAETFTHFTRLGQSTVNTASPEDPNSTGKVRSLSYGMRIMEGSTSDPGYYADLAQPAAIGTMFGYTENPVGNSFPGDNVRTAVRFHVPRSGVITLRLGMYAPTDASSDGILYKITRKYGENRSKVLTDGYQTAAADQSSEWSYLAPDTNGTLVQEVLTNIMVSADDVIELTFDKNANATADLFDLVFYNIDYLDTKMTYDMGEGLAVSDSFSGDRSETTTEYQSLTPVYPNSESSASPWRYGYFDTKDSFKSATVLTRPWFTTSRAPEDTTSNYPTALSYGYGSRLQVYNNIYGWDIKNTSVGYVGYDFGTAREGTNSFPGYANLGRAAVRFVAPKAGTVVPLVEFYDSTVHGGTSGTDTSIDGVLFKLYKKSVNGAVKQIYPTANEETYTASDNTNGWGLIPGSGAAAIWNDATVGLNAGDELILRFDPRSSISADEFAIRRFTVTYQEQTQYEYDMAEAFAVSNSFTGGIEGLYYDYVNGLTPVTPNGAGLWSLGYYNWNTEAFTPFTYLNRGNFTTTRAPEDTQNYFSSSATALIWSTSSTFNSYRTDLYVPEDVRDSATGNVQANCGTPAAIGYNFGSGRMNNNSFPGYHVTASQAAARFTVPYAGTISPTISMSNAQANGGILYRVYKVDGQTGAITDIYPMAGETTYTSADAGTSNWCLLPEQTTTLLTRNEAKVTVNVGDEIVFRFDKYTTGHPSGKEFSIDTLKINYVEEYEGNPIESYPAETVITFDAENTVLDLRRNKTTVQAKGMVSYQIENDTLGVLQETTTPGVYTLTGQLNDITDTNRTPLKVTASYYAPYNTQTPVYTTSGDIYVKSALRDIAPFTVAPLKTTDLGLDYDLYILPYYTDSVERVQYGTTDLGLNSQWLGATITFSVADKVEHLGNGFVRAIGEYTFADAGGCKEADSSVTKNLTSAIVTSKRDKNTIGTPITMTVTAPDGTKAYYYVLSFKTQIQDLTKNASNVYTMLDASHSQTTNAVLFYETYDAEGVFTQMVRDTGRTNIVSYLPRAIAEDRFTDRNWTGYIYQGYFWQFPATSKSYIESYIGTYSGEIGLAQTFVAPQSGTLKMTSFLPGELRTWLSRYMTDQKSGKVAVKLYDANDNLLKTLYQESWGPVKDESGSYSDENGTYYPWEFRGDAVYDSTVTGDKNSGISFNVEVGQKVRLMLELPAYTNAGYAYLGNGQIPTPVYTYTNADASSVNHLQKTELGDGTSRYDATVDIVETTKDSHYLVAGYDEDGILETASDGADLPVGSTEISVSLTSGEPISYLKIFLWESLENIRPLISGMLVY